MSWNREQFKDKYNRSKVNVDLYKEQDELLNYDDFYDIWADESRPRYLDDFYPSSMKDVGKGKLLVLLAKLKVRFAAEILKQLGW